MCIIKPIELIPKFNVNKNVMISIENRLKLNGAYNTQLCVYFVFCWFESNEKVYYKLLICHLVAYYLVRWASFSQYQNSNSNTKTTCNIINALLGLFFIAFFFLWNFTSFYSTLYQCISCENARLKVRLKE